MKLSKDSDSGSPSSIPQPDRQSALLLIDPQNDFFPGGAMGRPDGKNLIPVINAYIKHFSRQGFPILTTRDWHAPNHCSFTEQGGPHPTHCVQGSRGAQFHSDLVMPPGMMVISKGTAPNKDARSGFEESSLADRLEDLNVKTIFLLGPATQDCLTQTIVDACKLGFNVIILRDAIGTRPIADNFKEVSQAGALQATTSDFGIH
ncbi:MAG: isochorismatase family protein [Nitrospirota bacterium]|nr:isochorismatase family protein [Nitrospirota bacterium]MDH5587661.1 isochorismatase family protein [Nitrospirota bacterium]